MEQLNIKLVDWPLMYVELLD